MMNTLRNWTAALLLVMTMGGALVTVAAPQTASAACGDRLLTFPAWFRGLTAGDCSIRNPGEVGLQNFIWTIVLNVVEFILQLVGYISAAFILVGGFKYMTSGGSSDGMAKAKTTILNAIIGLIISIFSVGIINVIAGAIN